MFSRRARVGKVTVIGAQTSALGFDQAPLSDLTVTTNASRW